MIICICMSIYINIYTCKYAPKKIFGAPLSLWASPFSCVFLILALQPYVNMRLSSNRGTPQDYFTSLKKSRPWYIA